MFLTRKQLIFRFFSRLAFVVDALLAIIIFYGILSMIFIIAN